MTKQHCYTKMQSVMPEQEYTTSSFVIAQFTRYCMSVHSSLRTTPCFVLKTECYQTPKQENAKMRKRKAEEGKEGGREERAFTAVVRQCFL